MVRWNIWCQRPSNRDAGEVFLYIRKLFGVEKKEKVGYRSDVYIDHLTRLCELCRESKFFLLSECLCACMEK